MTDLWVPSKLSDLVDLDPALDELDDGRALVWDGASSLWKGKDALGPDPVAASLGFINWTHPLGTVASTIGMSAQSGKAGVTAVWLPGGKTISNVCLYVNTAGAGPTTPTVFRVGLISGGVLQAQSANLNGSALLTSTGVKAFPLSSTYKTLSAGLVYPVVLEVGTWSTDLLLGRNQGTSSSEQMPNGSYLWGGAGAGLSDLPANGSAMTVGATGASAYFWIGLS